VLALFGPTAVGKTEVALAVADGLRARGEDPVAVSADALQLYAGLERLTGSATAAERERLEHRMLGILPVTATASAGTYAARAHAEIDGLLAEGRRPIVVGGTGLYLRAALADLDLRPPPPPGVRKELNARLAAEGPAALHAALAAVDAGAAARIEPNDGRRSVRALESIAAGVPPPGGPSLWTREVRHPTLLVGLIRSRTELVARIDARVEAMVAAGAAEEVRRAARAGASPTARKALGFEELLAGDVEAMRRRTRAYAKRQITWMRKLPDVHLIDLTHRTPQSVADEVVGMI
jgi:tRNA dimethylallyltransferase